MVGIFGEIRESAAALTRDTTFRERFRDPRFGTLPWRRGRDVLLLAADGRVGERAEIPRAPHALEDAQLWFPPQAGSAHVAGPAHLVGIRVSGRLVRVKSVADIRFVPGVLVAVGRLRAHALFELDGADASLEHHLERKLRGIDDLTPGRLEQLLAARDRSEGPRPPSGPPDGVPPAARTILGQIEASVPGKSHVLAWERRGASGLISLLEDRGLIVVLPNGQILDRERYLRFARSVGSGQSRTRPQEAAGVWGTSVGTARALLGRMRADGLLDTVDDRHYKEDGDARTRP